MNRKRVPLIRLSVKGYKGFVREDLKGIFRDELLEDIDLVLREIKNLESGDQATSSMIRELIQQRQILFKIDVIQKL